MRRLWLAVLVPTVLLLSYAGDAQRPSVIPRIGFLGLDSRTIAPYAAGFVERLRALGYEDGRNVVIDYRWAEGQFDRLPALAGELVALNPAVIVAIAPPTARAAQQATATTPIVFMSREPVAMGFVASLARPGGNLTGVAFQDAELSAKRVELLRQVVPGLSTVAVFWNKEGAGVDAVRALGAATKPMGLELLTLEVREPADIATAVALARAGKAQGIIQLPSPLLTKHRVALVEAAMRERLPLMCEERVFVVEGCLMTYSANYVALARRMADYVDRILRGAKPSELPVE